MKWIVQTFVVSLILATAAGSADTLINIEEAAEIANFELRLDSAQSAVIYARACDRCETLALTVDAATAIRRGSSRLSLQQAADLNDKGATVLFNPSTQRVTRIIFWN